MIVTEFDLATSLLAILPEIALTVLALIVLALDLSLPKGQHRTIAIVAGLGLGFTAALPLILWPGSQATPEGLYWGGMVRHDVLSQIFKVMVLLAAGITCLMSIDVKGVGHRGEFYLIIIVSTLGMTLMAGAADLIMAFLALETTSIPLYLLAAFKRGDQKSAESGVKYFLFGSFASALMLFGMSLLFGFSGGQTSLYQIGQYLGSQAFADNAIPVLGALVLVIVGFGFKISAVPFHFWTPDVYEGAPTPITALISVASKAASFALLLRFFMAVFPGYDSLWVNLLAVSSVVTMTLGNVVALWQKNIKRLLAYSSIAQAGYTLIGVVAISAQNGAGMAAVIFYMFMYTLTNVGAFAVVILAARATGSEQIADLAGLSRRSPWLALAMTVSLLSLGGIPPAAGFFGKFFLFNAAVDSGFVWLALVGVINAIIALYYYLMVVKVMYVDRSASEDQPIAVAGSYRWALLVTTLGVIFLGVVASPVYNWALQASQGLLY